MNNEKLNKSQWQERCERPVASRAMTSAEIEEFRQILIRSYKCDDNDIEFNFQRITDTTDEDIDDCLMLKYTMKSVIAGKPVKREIFTSKIPIPEEIKIMADNLRQQQANKNKTPGPTLTLTPPEEVKKPALVKPVLKKQ